MSIKYYHLAKDEKPPDEFCAVRDVNGEPSEYTWYERMSDFDRELWGLFTQSDWFAGSEYRKLQSENAKLRELVRRYVEYTDQDCCEGCVVKSRCNDAEVDECWQFTEIRELARELGVEV